MPRCRKRDDRNTRPGTTTTSEADALVATAADLCARADELAALDAAALAWDGVADASRSDVCDHAATARVAARLQEVSASLNRIAAVDGEDPSRDPRHACAALAGAIASRLAIGVDALGDGAVSAREGEGGGGPGAIRGDRGGGSGIKGQNTPLVRGGVESFGGLQRLRSPARALAGADGGRRGAPHADGRGGVDTWRAVVG
jgi:hypothetical protein